MRCNQTVYLILSWLTRDNLSLAQPKFMMYEIAIQVQNPITKSKSKGSLGKDHKSKSLPN